jgi:hypothetical protein
MQKPEKKVETQDRVSLGALMLTIVIANVWVFAFLAPYA